jgi:hypothetical protein
LYKPAANISHDGKYILLSIRKDSSPARKLYIGDLEAAGNVIPHGYEWNKVNDEFNANFF